MAGSMLAMSVFRVPAAVIEATRNLPTCRMCQGSEFKYGSVSVSDGVDEGLQDILG